MSSSEWSLPESADEADTTEDTHDPLGAGDRPAHVCPECGRSFTMAMHLANHRRAKHGAESAKKDAAPRRANTTGETGQVSRRRRLVRETLEEILDSADAVRGRTIDPADLGDTIRRDMDLMSQALAGLAERWEPLGVGIDKMLGLGGPLSLIRAFLPTTRQLLRLWRSWAAERAERVAEFEAAWLAEQTGPDSVDHYPSDAPDAE